MRIYAWHPHREELLFRCGLGAPASGFAGAVAHEVPPGQPPAHAVLPLRPVPPDREPAPPREPAVEPVRRVVGREPLPDVGSGVGVTLARLRGGRRRLQREPRLVGGVVLPAGIALLQRCGFRGRHPGVWPPEAARSEKFQ